MMKNPILGHGEFEAKNVYLYVGDAVRYDFAPDKLTNAGLRASCVASSIHSPTSFASIVTGMYLPQHNIRWFSDSVTSQFPSLLESASHKTAFANTINEEPFHTNPNSKSIISNCLSTTENDSSRLNTIESPFVFLERGPGGHAPYGDFDGDAGEYFGELSGEPRDQLTRDYRRSVERDVDWFLSRLDLLSERGLLENTLVIYTSDHGEMLGESGMLGHNGIFWPSLVRVPCVFIHPDIKSGCVARSGVVRHVDLLPTIAGATGGTFQNQADALGRDLTTEPLAERGAAMYETSIFEDRLILPELRIGYESVWDTNGGYVFPTTSRLARAADMFRRLVISSKRDYIRQHFPKYSWSYLRGDRTHGTPLFSKDDARSELEKIYRTTVEAKDTPENDVPRERLEELGYLK